MPFLEDLEEAATRAVRHDQVHVFIQEGLMQGRQVVHVLLVSGTVRGVQKPLDAVDRLYYEV